MGSILESARLAVCDADSEAAATQSTRRPPSAPTRILCERAADTGIPIATSLPPQSQHIRRAALPRPVHRRERRLSSPASTPCCRPTTTTLDQARVTPLPASSDTQAEVRFTTVGL